MPASPVWRTWYSVPGSRTGTGLSTRALKRLKSPCCCRCQARSTGRRPRRRPACDGIRAGCTEILAKPLPPDPHRLVSHVVSHPDGIPERLQCGAVRLIGRKAGADVLRGGLFEVESDVVVDLSVGGTVSKQRADAMTDPVEQAHVESPLRPSPQMARIARSIAPDSRSQASISLRRWVRPALVSA